MADVITTLHPEGAPEDNLFPNVKDENIPSNILRKGVILWENADPNASFDAQTISLSDSVQNYTYLAIEYIQFRGTNTYGKMVQIVKPSSLSGIYYTIPYISQDTTVILLVSRAFRLASATSISVLDAYDTKVVDNRNIVPLAIYGIK